MRRITGFGTPILLSEAAYKSLKRKWRHENIVQRGSWYSVSGECPYCKKNMPKSGRCNLRCPLQAVFPNYLRGCIKLMKMVAEKHHVEEPTSLTIEGAGWRGRGKAESYVRAVEMVLNTAKRVKG